jgi:hypothetical protein
MARREKSVRERAREADRYREAAELALGQLQWCVNYLYRIRRPTLAAPLDRNRKHILSEVRRIDGSLPRRDNRRRAG